MGYLLNKVYKNCFSLIFSICLYTLLYPVNSYSQPFPREEVIASYIFNFAQNTEWKNEDEIDKFHFLIISSDKKIVEELNKISLKKRIRNKPVKISISDVFSDHDNTHLVFVARDKERDIVDVFDKIEGRNILLISDNFENKKMVMINFFETTEHKLKFEINKANIINQGLIILPDMVLLGGTEIDVAALYRESQVSLRTLQKQLDELQQHEQELKRKIETREFEIKRQQHIINVQTASIDSQTTQMLKQKLELQDLLAAIKLKQDTLSRQSNIILQHVEELDNQRIEIFRREKVLTSQQKKIDSQHVEIKIQAKSLKKQYITITKQQNVVYFLIIISLLGLGLVIAIYKSYIHKKEANTLLINEIEERKKVEEALGKSEDLYNNAPCGYHSLNKDGFFVGINDTELKWLGYQRDEIIGKIKFADLISGSNFEVFEENFSKFKAQGEIHDLQFDLIRKDGTILPVLLSATAITDKEGNFIMSRSNLFDVTYRRKAEKEIIQLNLELEQRVKDRTTQLENSNKELEAFSYSVSHDLRAPLRSIDGFSLILLEDYHNKIDAKGKDYLQRIRSATIRMALLIDDMLNLSKISRSDMNTRQVNLSSLAQDITNELRESQPERDVEVIIQEGITAIGDERLLRIVLENLIGNAWKFTSKNLTASIEFGMQYQEGIAVYFVSDDGAGFDMNYAQKLFGAFQRLHTNNEFSGSGIGLATVQRIIHRHGGEVWAEGEVEKGATFYFTIA